MEALDVILSCDFSFGFLMFDYAAGRRLLQEASSQCATQACNNLPGRALASSGSGRAAVGQGQPWVLHMNMWLIPPPTLLCGHLEGQVSAPRGALSFGGPLFSVRILAGSPGLVIKPLS